MGELDLRLHNLNLRLNLKQNLRLNLRVSLRLRLKLKLRQSQVVKEEQQVRLQRHISFLFLFFLQFETDVMYN